tara:strand:+ start:953 stop:1156 length:204 start_codon:yes stop_codon:yes gene_type:complete
MTDYKSFYERAYWNVRKVLECAEYELTSPHPLWPSLNELIETCDTMENILDIANPTDAFKYKKKATE